MRDKLIQSQFLIVIKKKKNVRNNMETKAKLDVCHVNNKYKKQNSNHKNAIQEWLLCKLISMIKTKLNLLRLK